MIQDIEREWRQITVANELISKLLIEPPDSSQLSAQSAAGNAPQKTVQKTMDAQTRNSEPLQNIDEDEINFFDDFSSKNLLP